MMGILKWGLVFLLIFSPIFKGGKEIAPLTFIQLFIILLAIIARSSSSLMIMRISPTMTADHLGPTGSHHLPI